MNCRGFRQALLEDDVVREPLERHAHRCEPCASLLAAQDRLATAVARWKVPGPELPAGLEERIAAAIETESSSKPGSELGRRFAGKSALPTRWRLAAAAVLAIGAALTAFSVMRETVPGPGIEAAVLSVERAGHDYRVAIAQLEGRARERLSRAGDPALPPQQAAILLAYRDRLTHLDEVIDEVRTFLDESPGHAGGHTVLLAAYEEKAEVLEELLELPLGESS